MKRKALLTMLLLTCLTHVIAQTNYYYYKGNKVFLKLNSDKVCVSLQKEATATCEQIQVNTSILQTITNDAFNIFVISQSDLEKLKTQDIWEEVSKSAILTPCFYTENNEEVALTPYLNVRLNKEEDVTLLNSFAAKNELQVVTHSLLMPLWYVLSVTRESMKNALEYANELYESGDFAAVPDLSSLTSETTGISVPDMKKKNVANTLFDLQGRRLSSSLQPSGALRPGIYIRNGRKFIQK